MRWQNEGLSGPHSQGLAQCANVSGVAMRVAHYSLGFPPFRTGGMTRYCVDLMTEQRHQGHEVVLLWPGKICDFGGSCSIAKRKSYFSQFDDPIESYELINPLPVPLLNGIRETDLFTHAKSLKTFESFFKEIKPDVFHVHTLQGLPQEALVSCRELGIKTVFTTHDFFGICPIASLGNHGSICTNDHGCADCWECNAGALSKSRLRFIQSAVYRLLKESSFMKVLRRRNNTKIGDPLTKQDADYAVAEAGELASKKYRDLRSFYTDMLERFDLVLGNSELTLKVFKKYLTPTCSAVVNVTHSAIMNHKAHRRAHPKLQIGYLGPRKDLKGYFVLRDALDELERSCPGTFNLNVYFHQGEGERSYLVSHDPYNYDDLPRIMEGLDVVIVPSTRYETFGFTALEAMSFGVPVIVSSSAGAKDIVEDGVTGIVCDASAESLAESIGRLISNPNRIDEMSKEICLGFTVPTMADHTKTIVGRYADLLRHEERSAAC